MKKLAMVLRVALNSLTVHVMRTVLTMLGIVIGVAAVISLVAVGKGAQAQVLSQFQALGSNLVTVSAMQNFGFSQSGLQTSSPNLTMADVKAIQALASSVSLVAPVYSSTATVTHGVNTSSTSINGVTEAYSTVRNAPVTLGRFISTADNDKTAMVAVLGTTVVEDLFGGTSSSEGSASVNPVGQTIRINRQNYDVIGVLESKGTNGPQNQDDVIMVPLHTAQLKLGGAGTTTVKTINLQVRSADEMDLAQAQVTAIMRSRHKLAAGADNDFLVRNQADILSSVTSTSNTFTTLLGSIAAISLLVGGIGIMNIMLVSVTERTREVGLRKAVGAKRGDILVQFLTEAIVISALGGLIGVVLGVGGAQVIAPLLGASSAVVTGQSIVLAVAVSLAIGVFFGLYPANRAAGLNPIEALRYE
jgi:putative ABC transport system permease protein